MKRDQQQEVQFYAKNNSTIADFLNEIKQWMPALYPDHLNQKLRYILSWFLSFDSNEFFCDYLELLNWS